MPMSGEVGELPVIIVPVKSRSAFQAQTGPPVVIDQSSFVACSETIWEGSSEPPPYVIANPARLRCRHQLRSVPT